MAEINITRMSSKGQVVIPREMRESFKEGEPLLVIRSGKSIILKRAKDLDRQLQEDILFAKRTDEALERYEKGTFKSMELDEFLSEFDKW